MSKELDNFLSASQSNITDFSTIETVLNSLLALPLEKALTPSSQAEDGIFKDISFACNISVEKVKKQSYFELICQLMNSDILPEVQFLNEEIICDEWAFPHYLSFGILSCLLRSASTNSVVTQFFNINLQAYAQYFYDTVGKYDYYKAHMVGTFLRSFQESFLRRDSPSINVTLDSTARKLFDEYIQAWRPGGETLESYGKRMLNIGQTLFYIAIQFPYEYITNYSKD